MSATDVIVWSQGGVGSSGHTSHHGGTCAHFPICATFFCSAAVIFPCATASGHGPGIVPLFTESRHCSSAFSLARKKAIPALAIVRVQVIASLSVGQAAGGVPQSRSEPSGT